MDFNAWQHVTDSNEYQGFYQVAEHFNQRIKNAKIPAKALVACVEDNTPHIDVFYMLKVEYSATKSIEAVLEFSVAMEVVQQSPVLRNLKGKVPMIDENFMRNFAALTSAQGAIFARDRNSQLFNATFLGKSKVLDEVELFEDRNEWFYKEHGNEIEHTVYAGQDARKVIDMMLGWYVGKIIGKSR